MNWTRLRNYCGFSAPYNFDRAIPALIAALSMAVLLVASLALIIVGAVDYGTTRASFLIYIGLLLIAALASLKFRKVPWIFLSLAIVELSVSSISVAANRAGLNIPSLFPQNTDDPNIRFKYHPLLGGIPLENFKSASGLAAAHNSKNMRGKEIHLSKDDKLIAVYGGSSTYDTGVPDGKTWAEMLQKKLDRHMVVGNFGVPGYSSAEHVIQTAFYSNILGKYPACAVYYIGWNDIHNAHIPNLDSAYANYHLISQYDSLQVRRKPDGFSPLANVIESILKKTFDTIPYPEQYRALKPKAGTDPTLEQVFVQNIRSLVSLNNGNGVRSIFIGQLLNRSRLTGDVAYGWLPLVKDKDVWPLQERFNAILKREAGTLKAGFVPVDIDRFEDADFIDQGHFSAQGTEKFAGLIGPSVARLCK